MRNLRALCLVMCCAILVLTFIVSAYAQVNFNLGYGIDRDLSRSFKKVSKKRIAVIEKAVGRDLRSEGCIEIGHLQLQWKWKLAIDGKIADDSPEGDYTAASRQWGSESFGDTVVWYETGGSSTRYRNERCIRSQWAQRTEQQCDYNRSAGQNKCRNVTVPVRECLEWERSEPYTVPNRPGFGDYLSAGIFRCGYDSKIPELEQIYMRQKAKEIIYRSALKHRSTDPDLALLEYDEAIRLNAGYSGPGSSWVADAVKQRDAIIASRKSQ